MNLGTLNVRNLITTEVEILYLEEGCCDIASPLYHTLGGGIAQNISSMDYAEVLFEGVMYRVLVTYAGISDSGSDSPQALVRALWWDTALEGIQCTTMGPLHF